MKTLLSVGADSKTIKGEKLLKDLTGEPNCGSLSLRLR